MKNATWREAKREELPSGKSHDGVIRLFDSSWVATPESQELVIDTFTNMAYLRIGDSWLKYDLGRPL